MLPKDTEVADWLHLAAEDLRVAVRFRSPPPSPLVDRNDADHALAVAQRVWRFVLAGLPEPLKPVPP